MCAAMELFGLQQRRLFRDAERGTMVAVAWSADLILVVARGTSEMANVKEDARVRSAVGWHAAPALRLMQSCLEHRACPRRLL